MTVFRVKFELGTLLISFYTIKSTNPGTAKEFWGCSEFIFVQGQALLKGHVNSDEIDLFWQGSSVYTLLYKEAKALNNPWFK